MVKPDKLLAYIEDTGLSYRQNTISFIFDCPKCLKKDKLYVRKRDGRFVCWFCKEQDGYQGRPEFAFADLTLTPIELVREALYGRAAATDEDYFDLKLPDWFGEGDDIDEDAVAFETMQYPYYYCPILHPFSERGREYLAYRGISLELADLYDIHYSPRDRRIIFPVKLGGRLVGWQSRTVVNHRTWSEEKQDYVEFPKMLSSKGIPTAHTVMFADRLRGEKHVVVCEGPIDAIKAHLCGGNVATMGKAIGPGQVEAIRHPERLTRQEVGQLRYAGVERVYLALDPDAARETTRLVREFSDLEVYVVRPAAGCKDIGEMSLDGVRDAFLSAKRVSTANIFVHFDAK